MSEPRHVIIIGLGVAGPLCALTLLQRTGVSVTIYELRSAPATIGGALNLAPNAVRQLHRLGFDVEHLGASIPTILMQNAKGQQLALHVYGGPNNAFARPYTGRRVMRKDLMNAMLAALKPYEENNRVTIVFSKKATKLEEDGERATVHFEDGTSDTADLILGADGIHSWTRTYMQAQMFYLPSDKLSKAQYTGLASLYAIVDMNDLPQVAIDRIREQPMIVTSSQTAGVVVACAASNPLKEIIWFSSRAPLTPPSPDTPAPDPDELRKDFTETYGGYPPPYPELIQATKSFAYWPVYRLDPLPSSWTSPKGRVVLLGDAAHAMPPHAAQGVGMGVEDSILIAKILAAVESSDAWGRITGELWHREYQNRRLPRCKNFMSIAEQRGHARKPQGWFSNVIREWMMWFAAPILRLLSRWRDTEGWGYEIDKGVRVRVP